MGERSAVGAYGLAVGGVEAGGAVAEALVPAPPDWPGIVISRKRGAPVTQGPEFELGSDSGRIRLPGRGVAIVDRVHAVATFEMPDPLDDDRLVHPMLGYVATAFSGWLGRHVFHAGAVVVDGGAWAFLGERGAGKSSTLGWLAQEGQPILADDLLVIDGGTAFAGPRSVDLAPDMAAHLGVGDRARDVRGGYRRRITVEAVRPEHPFRGWIVLSWANRVEVTRVSAGNRLAQLANQMHPPLGPPDWDGILKLAEAPMLELHRPRRLSSLGEAGASLIEAVGHEAA